MLYNKDKTKLVAYPVGSENICYGVPRGVTEIGDFAFNNVQKLECVNIPLDVTNMGYFAFGMGGFECITNIRYEGNRENWEAIEINEWGSGWVSYEKSIVKVFNNYTEGKHTLASHTVDEPSCIWYGYDEYICSCGFTHKITIPATGHIPEAEYRIITPATCEYSGLEKLYCSVCETQLDQKSIPKLGHDKVFVEYLDPTCELVGGNLYKCNRCQKDVFEEDAPALGHKVSETKILIEPTCTANGGLYYSCENCGEPIELIESYEATGHTEGEWKHYQDATCTQQQIDILYCATCKREIKRQFGAKGEHNYVGEIVSQDCTTVMWYYRCTSCGDYYYDEVTGSTVGHVTEIITVEPSCTEAGRSYKRCTVCGETVGYITVIDPLGHDFEETITKEASCSEEGVLTKTCLVCGAVEEEVILKTAHTFGSWEYESGNTFSGLCALCGESFESIEVELTLDYSEVEIYNKTSKKIIATVTENITEDIEFTTSDETIATVDSTGRITAKAPGEAIITARIKNSDVTAECKVSVLARSFGIEWIVDGETLDYYFVEEGSKIEAPEAPEKAGFVFVGWTPEIPDVMPGESLTFTAVYNIVSQSANYDVSATYSVDAFDEPVFLDVKEVEDEREPGGIYMVDGQSYNQVGLYNIKAVNSNSEVIQPNDGHRVTIKLALPSAYANRTSFVVYHRFVDGTREQLSTAKGNLRVENGYLIFDVSSFSEFEVLAVTSTIEITKLPDKTTYAYKLEKIDLTGIVVTFKNSNGTVKTIDDPSMLTVTGFNNNKLGKQVVTVHYGQYSDSMQINVTYSWWQFIINMLTFGLFFR